MELSRAGSVVIIVLFSLMSISECYRAGVGDYDQMNDREIGGARAGNGQRKATWVSASRFANPPEGAVVVGYLDQPRYGRRPGYLGRVNHLGNQIPVKVHPSLRQAWTHWNNNVFQVASYEVLTYGNLAWVAYSGEIPYNALVVGHLATGEKVYVGRGRISDNLEPGMVIENDRVLYIAYGAVPARVTNYELLIDLDQERVCSC